MKNMGYSIDVNTMKKLNKFLGKNLVTLRLFSVLCIFSNFLLVNQPVRNFYIFSRNHTLKEDA
jgi:hypothetical protein